MNHAQFLLREIGRLAQVLTPWCRRLNRGPRTHIPSASTPCEVRASSRCSNFLGPRRPPAQRHAEHHQVVPTAPRPPDPWRATRRRPTSRWRRCHRRGACSAWSIVRSRFARAPRQSVGPVVPVSLSAADSSSINHSDFTIPTAERPGPDSRRARRRTMRAQPARAFDHLGSNRPGNVCNTERSRRTLPRAWCTRPTALPRRRGSRFANSKMVVDSGSPEQLVRLLGCQVIEEEVAGELIEHVDDDLIGGGGRRAQHADSCGFTSVPATRKGLVIRSVSGPFTIVTISMVGDRSLRRHFLPRRAPARPTGVPAPVTTFIPADSAGMNELSGADDRARTGDLDLGKVALYQLSYVRVVTSSSRPPPKSSKSHLRQCRCR